VTARRLLITAGPTHEPIDEVRYLANRSSGRLGIALAEAAADRGWQTTLLLGPTPRECDHPHVGVVRFRTAEDLRAALEARKGDWDVLVMAAAVADYRPRAAAEGGKLRRTSDRMTLELEPTPDLLAGVAARRQPGQTLVGFALEPREELRASALRKLERKSIDAIVANPLETMDADTVEASLIWRSGDEESTGGPVPKTRFAAWLLDAIERGRDAQNEHGRAAAEPRSRVGEITPRS